MSQILRNLRSCPESLSIVFKVEWMPNLTPPSRLYPYDGMELAGGTQRTNSLTYWIRMVGEHKDFYHDVTAIGTRSPIVVKLTAYIHKNASSS